MCDVYRGISETNIIKAKEAVAAAVGKGNSSTRLSCGRKKKIYTLLLHSAGHSKQAVNTIVLGDKNNKRQMLTRRSEWR